MELTQSPRRMRAHLEFTVGRFNSTQPGACLLSSELFTRFWTKDFSASPVCLHASIRPHGQGWIQKTPWLTYIREGFCWDMMSEGIPFLWCKNRALSLECWLDLRAEPISDAAKRFKGLLPVQLARGTCSPEITAHGSKDNGFRLFTGINWNTQASNKVMQLLAPESHCAQQIHSLLVGNGLLNHSTQQLIMTSVNQHCPLTWNNATTTAKGSVSQQNGDSWW